MPDPSLEMELMQLAFGDAKAASGELIRQIGKRFPAGATLFKEGDRSEELFILLRGEVEIFTGLGSHQHRLANLTAGQIFGEMSHFDDQPRSASARALSPVDALALNKENFALIFQLHPKWTIQLVEGLAGRIERTLSAFAASLP